SNADIAAEMSSGRRPYRGSKLGGLHAVIEGSTSSSSLRCPSAHTVTQVRLRWLPAQTYRRSPWLDNKVRVKFRPSGERVQIGCQKAAESARQNWISQWR